MKPLRIALLGAAVAVALAFAGIGLPGTSSGGSASQGPRSITVSGTGTVSSTPTQALFTFGVATQGTTAAGALSADSAQMQKLIDALKAAGIPAKSIQTSDVSLSPRTASDGDTIIGYDASNSVSVTIDDITHAGAIVDVAVGAGANQVDGPNLTVADQTELYQSALKNAISDARAKAQALASASGLHVGAVSSVEEQTDSSVPVRYAADAATGGQTPIQAGSQQITATVTVVFDAS